MQTKEQMGTKEAVLLTLFMMRDDKHPQWQQHTEAAIRNFFGISEEASTTEQ